MGDGRRVGRRRSLTSLAVALAALLFNASFAASPALAITTYTAAASGDWTSPATWAGGVAPALATTGADFITIPAGVTVTISSSTTVGGGAHITNQGGLVVAGLLNVAGSLTNSIASLTVNSGGTLIIGGASYVSFQNYGSTVTNHGTFDIGANGTLTNSGGARIESDGVVEILGGGQVTNMDVSQITTDVGGRLINDAGTYFLNQPHAQIVNHGSFINQGGASFSNYGGFTNYASVTNHGGLDILAGGFVNFSGFMTNDGIVTVYASNGFFNNHGATFVNSRGGSVIVRGAVQSFLNEGAVTNANGATFSVWSTFLNEIGTFENHGLLDTPNGAPTITNTGNGKITNDADGSIAISRYATLENDDPDFGPGAIFSYGTIVNGRLIDVGGGLLHVYAGAITNDVGASITIGAWGALILESGVTLTNARFASIANAGLVENNLGTIQNHGAIASTGTGRLANGGTAYNYCADGATVTGTVYGYIQGIACATTFTQTGIPSTTWGVTANGTHYGGSGPSIVVNGLTGTVSYAYDATLVDGDTRYDCTLGCGGSVASGGTVSATYAASYRVRYQATGCALPVPLPSATWIAAGNAPYAYFPSSVYSNDDPTSTICDLVSDDRPATITGPTTITATYQTFYLLTVQNGLGGGQSYDLAGTPVTLTADSVPGMIFVGWQLDDTAYPAFVATITFTMDAPHTATAIYETPLQATQSLLGTVSGAGLAAGTTQSLAAKLDAAAAALGRGDTKAASGQLGAFVNAVQAQSGKAIPADEAALLIAAAQAILGALH